MLADEDEVEQTFGTLDARSGPALERSVGGARVTCVWRDQRVSMLSADEHGAFVAQLPQGVYDLVISARGYLSLFVRGVGVLGGIPPDAGARPRSRVRARRLEGEQATAIAGYVFDRIGRTVPGVSIYVEHRGSTPRRTPPAPTAKAPYVLHGVVPGMYDLVRAQRRSHASARARRDRARQGPGAARFAPGTALARASARSSRLRPTSSARTRASNSSKAARA